MPTAFKLTPTESASASAELLAQRLRMATVKVLSGTPVMLAYAYGSRVWGKPRPTSDLDLGYYLVPGSRPRCLTLHEELSLASKLSDAVGQEVDFRCLEPAPLALRGRALVEGIRVFCADDVARTNLERDLLGEYLDYKPKLDALSRLRLASIAAREG